MLYFFCWMSKKLHRTHCWLYYIHIWEDDRKAKPNYGTLWVTAAAAAKVGGWDLAAGVEHLPKVNPRFRRRRRPHSAEKLGRES